MAQIRHLYFYIENLGLTAAQRDTLVQWFRDFNTSRSPYPEYNMQVRMDNQAAIFETALNRAWLEEGTVQNKLGEIFAVDPATITATVIANPYGELVRYNRPSGTPRLIFGVFGGRDATWEQSGEQARAYLAANAIEKGLLLDMMGDEF